MRFFLLFLSIISLAPLYAHQSGLSFLEIKKQANNTLHVTYKKPLSDTRVQDIFIQFPQKCIQLSDTHTTIHNGFIFKNYTLACGTSGLENETIWIQGLVASDRGIMVRYETPKKVYKALLRASSPFIQIGKDTTKLKLFKEYLQLGIVHILSGFDHLSFVLGLLLLARNMKKLLWAISGFTLSHSFSLALSILSTINISSRFVESMIALSILFLAKEILLTQETFTKKHLGFVAFLFGLVHGLGFSSNLMAIGLPHNEIALSLFSFNLGIELGQLLFIAIASILLHVSYKFFKQTTMHTLLAYAIGSLGTLWLLQRVIQ